MDLKLKYRPQTFSELVGQDVIRQVLINMISSGEIGKLLIFYGCRGSGKTSSARIMAKSLNCSAFESPTLTPCGKCDNCTSIAKGNNPDVQEIDAATHTSVDNARALSERMLYTPLACKWKVFIIDEAHRLSKQAFDALLKPLEEGAPNVLFIFCTTDINSIPETIRSRADLFRFDPIAPPVIAEQLQLVASQEQIAITPEAIYLIAHQSRGGMRDSLKYLSQVKSFVGQQPTPIEAGQVKLALRLRDVSLLIKVLQHLMKGNLNPSEVATTAQELQINNPTGLIEELLNLLNWTQIVQIDATSQWCPLPEMERNLLISLTPTAEQIRNTRTALTILLDRLKGSLEPQVLIMSVLLENCRL